MKIWWVLTIANKKKLKRFEMFPKVNPVNKISFPQDVLFFKIALSLKVSIKLSSADFASIK